MLLGRIPAEFVGVQMPHVIIVSAVLRAAVVRVIVMRMIMMRGVDVIAIVSELVGVRSSSTGFFVGFGQIRYDDDSGCGSGPSNS